MSEVIVFDTVGEEVVYSTTCFENAHYVEGPQTIFETWKKALDRERMSAGPEEAQRIRDVFDGSLSIVNGSLQIGMIFTPPPVNIACGILAGMGGLIQVALRLTPGQPDPVKEQFKLLVKKMQELDKKIREGFEDMKQFITECKFSEEIIAEVSTLKKFLNDCLSKRTEESIENFRIAYEQNSPLDIAYSLASLLEQKTTNPLLMAIEKEGNKSEAFDRWEKIFYTILGDLKFIESIGSGILKNQNMYDCQRIIEQEREIKSSLATWKYENFDDYWKNINFDHIMSADKMTNNEKAESILKYLTDFSSTDSFYVVVFDESAWQSDYTYQCFAENVNMVGSWHKSGHSAFVYRSREAHKKRPEDFARIENEVSACRFETLVYNGTLEGAIQDQLLYKNYISDVGFVALLWKDKNVSIRSSNCQGHEWGPGWWITACNRNSATGAVYQYYLIAAFD